MAPDLDEERRPAGGAEDAIDSVGVEKGQIRLEAPLTLGDGGVLDLAAPPSAATRRTG
ncbi:MAG: hypothetical protein JF888_07840 [Candidatus Dormibacteraeota bacterium]|uniref:Uncharacterized protein n=1 Tax=Candidatus Dormiibacter inghamiae TaxID=3127013 RepID=A0A934NH61_9BACT|nr:hypothetical protein [Candidatus Dormibacteraeota bacterium]MBJ7606930.1 hypothetical protein [Candidatus Dormibacteraeota bacterium]